MRHCEPTEEDDVLFGAGCPVYRYAPIAASRTKAAYVSFAVYDYALSALSQAVERLSRVLLLPQKG